MEHSSIVDSLGCGIKPTFFVTNDGTDYNYVNYFSKLGIVL